MKPQLDRGVCENDDRIDFHGESRRMEYSRQRVSIVLCLNAYTCNIVFLPYPLKEPSISIANVFA